MPKAPKSAKMIREMPISILGLSRSREGSHETHAFLFDTLEDLELATPIKGQATVTLIDFDTFLVSVRATGKVRVNCDRCLKELTTQVEIDTHVEYSTDPNDDQRAIEHNAIDLAPLVRDEILLNLPIKQLCSQACVGIPKNTI